MMRSCVSIMLLLLGALLMTTEAAGSIMRHPFTPSETADMVSPVQALVGRLFGEEAVAKFHFEPLPGNNGSGPDVFEISQSENVVSDGSPQFIVIRGSTVSALTSGLNWYLKYYCFNSASWGWDGTGNNLNLPDLLPAVAETVRVESPVQWRYYMNVCTVSYSMAWWDWARWEQEIDWMALNGINMPLAFTGQEYIWTKVYSELGLTNEELEEHFAGPAFLAWGRMGNLRGWGGPLSAHWMEDQNQLQKKILARQRSLGMTPVLPAFAGHVPQGVKRVFPDANITLAAGWGNFNSTYSDVYLLEPLDPLFNRIGSAFVKAVNEEWGSDHIYNCDTFNEMDPGSSDLTYLKDTSAAVFNAMRGGDDNAIWLMQGWLFHSQYWSDDRIAAYLSGVPNDKMIILDLNSEQGPLWDKFVDNGKPFVWCMLHNYGGERNLYGNMSLISTAPIDAREAAGDLMVGTGITMEAIEQNPVMYELMNEMGWRSNDFSLADWVRDYAQRRYGVVEDPSKGSSALESWELLKNGVYTSGFSWVGNSFISRKPGLGTALDRSMNTTALVEAWRLMVASAAEYSQTTEPWGYDLVDISRQVLSNHFADLTTALQSAWSACFHLEDTFQTFENTDSPGNDIGRIGDCGAGYPSPCHPTHLQQLCLANPRCGAINSNGWMKPAENIGRHTRQQGSTLYERNQEFRGGCSAQVASLASAMLDAIADFDLVLSSDVNYLLGVWIEKARALGGSDEEKDLLEFNARNQVTLWGPDGNIDDYASKQWSGLVSGYHKKRWQLFLGVLKDAAAQGRAPDWDKYSTDELNLGRIFCEGREKYPTSPQADIAEVSENLLRKYVSDDALTSYKVLHNAKLTAGLYTTWTKDPSQLAHICDADMNCAGFTSDGLVSSTAKSEEAEGSTVWIKMSRVSLQ